MNRKLIAVGVAAALTLPLAANAAPKVYGKLNLSVEQYEKDNQNPATADADYTRLQSNASRFGVKGEDELTATLSAVYGMEWEVSGDGSDMLHDGNKKDISGSDFKQRNRFVGIKSQDFGTIKLGKYDSYFKLAQGEVDLFNDYFTLGDMAYTVAGENRLNNVVGYESPKLLDVVQVNVMAQTQDAADDRTKNNVQKNGVSASVVFNNEELGVYAALAMDNNVEGKAALYTDVTGKAASREHDAWRAVVVYKIAALTLNGLYNVSESSASVLNGGIVDDKGYEESAWLLGAAYKIGDETLKVQYSVAEADDNTQAVQERTMWSVGVDHNFTSKTKAFAWYTVAEEDRLAANADTEETAMAIGLEHKF